MTSLLLHAGQSILCKQLSEARDGSWAKVLLRESHMQQSSNISLTRLGASIPFRSRALYFLTEWGQFPRLQLFPLSPSQFH